MNLRLIREVSRREYKLFIKGRRLFIGLVLSLIVSVTTIFSITSLAPELRSVFSPTFAAGYYFLINGVFLPICLIVIIQASNIFSRECERNMHQLLYVLPIDTCSLVIGKMLALWTSIAFLVALPFLAIVSMLTIFLELEVSIMAIMGLFLVLMASAMLMTSYSFLASVLSRKDGTSMTFAMMIVLASIMLNDHERLKFVSPNAFLSYLTTGINGIEVEPIALVMYVLSLLVGVIICPLVSWWLLEKRLAYMF